MIKIKNIPVVVGFVLICLGFSALVAIENPILEKIRTNLAVWKTNYGPEKVYLHHDKPYYMAGEVIWLKAYLVHASGLTPSKKSKILYVDLINEKNELVKKLKLEAEQGRTHGDLSIPGNIQEGQYTLVAYTNWMKNFGEDDFFKKAVHLVTGIRKQPTGRKGQHGARFSVFPGGGGTGAWYFGRRRI